MSEQETELTGDPDGKPHREIDLKTGQQRAYVILSEEERAKGFVEPVRKAYVHVGPPSPNILRDLTDEEKMRYEGFGYAKFQVYPGSGSVTGKFWTQDELDRINGCGGKTIISQSIAETYARDPSFYSGTFCSICRNHFDIGEKGEFVWDGTDQRVGTKSQ